MTSPFRGAHVVTADELYSATRTPPAAEVRQTSAQSIPNNAFTSVLFDVEDLDTEGGHSTVTNTSRYTASVAGWYLCSGGVGFAASATGRRGARWAVNGTAVNGSELISPATAASTGSWPVRGKLVYLAVNDYLELQAYQDSGGALNTSVAAASQPTMTALWTRVT